MLQYNIACQRNSVCLNHEWLKAPCQAAGCSRLSSRLIRSSSRCSRGRLATVNTAHRDLTADILENVTCLALRARLKECRAVKTSISCDTWSLLAGRVNGVKIHGEGWRSPLNLTAQVLEATVGEASLDPSAVLFKQQILLTNVPVGTARVMFNAADFGNFLVHPLMTEAAKEAVQGHAFAFDQASVRIQPPSAVPPEGLVEFTGTWRGDGQRYQVRLLPVSGGAVFGKGVQAHAMPLSIGARSSSAGIVEDCLSAFFSSLMVDLQGAQMSFMSLAILPGMGFAGAMADLNLRLELKKFPPLNVQF
uniref:Uncharacterized protein n=1 Tax=Tetradesmus obliquus TaxID=3088 RepID=A0A383VV08_TETOB|eukprot:jgi/Sobl393_1/6754/SZX68622.1